MARRSAWTIDVMPIYEYECGGCKHQFQKLMKISDPAPNCPECDSNQSEKKISVGSFLLKGSGWYKDGYGLRTNTKS